MRRLMLIISIFCLLAIFAIGQIEPENWQTYSPENEEFSVEMPVIPIGGIHITDKNKRVFNGKYQTFANGNYYFIHSENIKNNSLDDELKNLLKSYQSSEINFQFGGLTGKKYTFADDEGFYQQILIINSKNRFYIFHAVSEIKDDETLNRFFNSLKFFEAKEQLTLNDENTKRAKFFEQQMPNNRNYETNSAKDNPVIKNNPPINSPIPNSTVSTNKPVIQTFKITKQQSASYTDLARYYGIMGAVRLKVTFLANGTIGAISVRKKLPFGLTNQSIKAAKSVEFVAGSVTVSKTIEYGFTLY